MNIAKCVQVHLSIIELLSFCDIIIIMIVLKIILYLLLAFIGLNLLFFLLLWLYSLTIKKEPTKGITPSIRFASDAFFTWAVGMAGVKVHVTGEDKIPTDSRYLFVSNHRGIFDPVAVEYKLGHHNIGFITKPSNMNLPIIGRLAWGLGYIPIDRENDRKALESIIQATKYIKSDICSIGIYPEGTRSKQEGMLPFHAGSFKIAQKAKVPVVISSCKNSDMVFKNFPIRTTDIYLDILEVIPAEKVLEMSTSELADYSYKLIEEHLYG